MELAADVKCPYCGKINKAIMKDKTWDKIIVGCFSDNGGCDKDFVVIMSVEIKATARKIEGE